MNRSENLQTELLELQRVAQGGTTAARAAAESIDRLAKLGDEELDELIQDRCFDAQQGTDTQALRIAAFYAKLGLPVQLAISTLKNPELTVGQARMELDERVMVNLQKAGAAMTSKLRRVRWNGFGVPAECVLQPELVDGTGKDLNAGRATLRHAESMLSEYDKQQQKAQLYKTMRLEGMSSPMRRHVARNIRERLKDEKDPEAEKLEMQHQINSIRRDLSQMGQAKKNLNGLRSMLKAEEEQKRKEEEAKKRREEEEKKRREAASFFSIRKDNDKPEGAF